LHDWLAAAQAVGEAEPNAMTLATIDDAGHPAARTVLCKELRHDGVVFYTNFNSDKATQLVAVPFAAAVFTWARIARQVRLHGSVRRIPAADTARYWQGRPRGSQLGAWASAQSRPIDSRAALDSALAETAARFADVAEIPVPPHWGGYLIVVEEVEFWQGHDNRLHDRIRLTRTPDGDWTATRLQP
jgi:pyridoxamine 5'-phosphate oxidase